MAITVSNKIWDVYKFPLAGFCKHLRITYPADEKQWRQWAPEYWCGRDKEAKRTGKNRIRLDAPHPGAPVHFFKRFLVRNKRDRIKRLFKKSRARRTFDAAEALQARGFAAPRHRCIIELVSFGLVRESALVSEDLSQAESVSDALADKRADSKQKRRLVQELGGEIGRLHRAGIYHGDLRLGNVLCRETEDGSGFCFIDNERTRVYRRLPMARRLQNLVQANMMLRGVTMTDRLRFWKAYQRAGGLSDKQAACIIRTTMERTRKRWKRKNWLAPDER